MRELIRRWRAAPFVLSRRQDVSALVWPAPRPAHAVSSGDYLPCCSRPLGGRDVRNLQRLFVDSGLLAKDSIVADVGGNIGYYAMWLSRVAAPKGCVYCFEPSPDALPLLRHNLQVNRIENVQVIDSACGNYIGTTDFFLAPDHYASSLHVDWVGSERARRVAVPMITLDTFFSPERMRQPPVFIKFDIEGGGTYALPGCQRIFREARPFALIKLHTPDEDRAISHVLDRCSYRAYRLNNRKWVEKPHAVHPDEAGVWGTLLQTLRKNGRIDR